MLHMLVSSMYLQRPTLLRATADNTHISSLKMVALKQISMLLVMINSLLEILILLSLLHLVTQDLAAVAVYSL